MTDKQLEYHRKYREKNRERIRAYKANYQQENREKINAYMRQWRKDNPDKAREIAHRYYENKLKRTKRQEADKPSKNS